MDLKLKGITWVGNIYQKFEAVCQEVDNIVSQDAIKYVENQVQSAGENVKKLYSNVVLDLVPPVVGPTKHKTQSQPSRRNAAVGSLLNSTTAKEIWKDHVDTADRQSQESDAFDLPKCSQDFVARGQFSGYHTNEVEEPICESIENDCTETKSCVKPKRGSHMSSRQNVVKSIPLTVHSNSTTVENSSQTLSSMEPSAGIAQNINEVEYGKRENVDVSVEEEDPIVSDDVVLKASSASSFTMERIDPQNPVEKNYAVSTKHKTEDFATEVADWVSPIKEMSSEYLTPVHSLDDIYQNVNEFHVHGKGKLDLFGEYHSLITAETASMEFAPLFLDGLSPKNESFQGSVIAPSIDDFSENFSDDMVQTPAAGSYQNKNFQSSPQVETDEAEYDPSYLDTLATLEMDRLCLVCSLSSGSLPKNTPGSFLEKSLKNNPVSLAKVDSTISNSHLSCSTAPVRASDVMTLEVGMCSLCRMQPLKPRRPHLLQRGGSDSDSANSSMENIALSDAPKLEENCVIVNDSQLHAVSSRVQKFRSYRKRIQDVFTSKKRLVKEYELLAVWFGDADIEPGQNNSRTPSALNSSASFNRKAHACDSEWELL